MKTSTRIIKAIAQTPIVKKIIDLFFDDIRQKYNKKLDDERNRACANYGVEVLDKFDKCMKENNFFYTLAYGSILGAIREHGFIKHDLDIDVYMWIEDYSPKFVQELQKVGFTWLHSYTIDNGKYGREDTFECKGVTIDVFWLYPPINQYPYSCLFLRQDNLSKNQRLPQRLEMPIKKHSRLEKFETLQLPVPINAEEICEMRYGPNYMTPDPSWHWEDEKNTVVEWHEMIPFTIHQLYPTLDK